MRKLILLFTIISVWGFGQSLQNKIFLSNLLQDNILILNNKGGDRAFNVDEVEIQLEVIPSKSSYISSYYTFYLFELGKDSLMVKDTKIMASINSSKCNKYIIAINNKDYSSYKIFGFSTNDFLFLLRACLKIK